nr:hypothetical protein [Tanacetum cinerariifolium]
QTSSLKPYVPNVILEKIIIDLEDEVVNLLEKEKVYLETIESLKSKGFESSETVSSESENQNENDCLVVEKECDKEENPKVIALGMFKLNVSQCVSPISMSKSSCDSNNVEIKLKRKRRKRKSSKQNVKQVDNDVSRVNNDFVHFSDLDTFSSVRRPKHTNVVWKKKGSSNTSNIDMFAVSVSNLNKNVKTVHKWLPKLQPLAEPVAKWFPRVMHCPDLSLDHRFGIFKAYDGALYTTGYCCSNGSLKNMIICDLNKTPDLFQEPPENCPKCGNPVDGHYCQGCALLRKKFKEDLFTYCIENGIFQDFQDTSGPSNNNTNVVNALQETFCINTPSWDRPTICYNDDDDEDYSIEITPILSTKEPDNSLSMGDEHLDTITATELDEFIKFSVENLVLNPSESKGKHECNVPACEDFTTFSNLLFDADDDFSSSEDQSFYDEDIPKKIYSNPLFDEEIVSMKIDPHHFNAESDLIESLFNHDSSIISSSSKIDSLLDEFAGELTLLKSIPPRIDETNYDQFISKNSDAAIESFSPFPILVEDSDSYMEEIDLSFTPDDPMPPGIEEDDYDSERDILILEELLSNDSLSLPENESFHFDIPSSSRPPAKPPDGNLGILNVKVMGDISEHNVLMLTQPTLVLNQEKSLSLLSHQGRKASQPSTGCPMMIYGRNTSILNVPFLHFYPP